MFCPNLRFEIAKQTPFMGGRVEIVRRDVKIFKRPQSVVLLDGSNISIPLFFFF